MNFAAVDGRLVSALLANRGHAFPVCLNFGGHVVGNTVVLPGKNLDEIGLPVLAALKNDVRLRKNHVEAGIRLPRLGEDFFHLFFMARLDMESDQHGLRLVVG